MPRLPLHKGDHAIGRVIAMPFVRGSRAAGGGRRGEGGGGGEKGEKGRRDGGKVWGIQEEEERGGRRKRAWDDGFVHAKSLLKKEARDPVHPNPKH